jgi:hypothetical protein
MKVFKDSILEWLQAEISKAEPDSERSKVLQEVVTKIPEIIRQEYSKLPKPEKAA